MEIKSAHIKLLKKGSFHAVQNEGLRHVKVLPYLSIVQSVEGSYDIALGNGAVHSTGEGGFFIAPAGVRQTIVHHVSPTSGKMSCRWLFIDVEINKAFSPDALYRFPTVITDERKAELDRLFDRLFETDDLWQNHSDCYALLGHLTHMATPIENRGTDGISHALSHMAEHYKRPLTVNELAECANLSPSHFYAAFKKRMGLSPIAYLNSYRLSLAADRLTDTSLTVAQISDSVGITDPLYFSKLFKKTYGMTPTQYRLLYRENA